MVSVGELGRSRVEARGELTGVELVGGSLEGLPSRTGVCTGVISVEDDMTSAGVCSISPHK